MSDENIKLSPFIANSLPRSGTHLLRQILLGIPGIQHSLAVYGYYEDQPKDNLIKLSGFSHNEFGSGHLFYSAGWKNYLISRNIKQLFLYRDPRDVIVSYAHLIPQHKLHHLHAFFKEKAFEERIRFLLDGGKVISSNNIVDQPSFYEWYLRFARWKSSEKVLPIRYEDLVCNEESRRKTLLKIINYLNLDKSMTYNKSRLVELMSANINPHNCRTFRKGKIGSWKEELDDELKRYFKIKTGTLVADMKYIE
ncbi:sulfotransferase domain-containing protein [Lysinibacillus sphaericus]